MKHFFALLLFLFLTQTSLAQNNQVYSTKIDKTKKLLLADAACGECQFKMKGKGCNLAVRINGKDYFVDGTSIDDHGDAHSDDGFCNSIRKAQIQGDTSNNRFKVTYFKLLPADKNSEVKNKK